MDERRIGVYGGTFDPIHSGHTEIACAITRNFDLDRMLLIPASRPPHKTGREISDAYHRYAMAVLATLDQPRITVSTIELEAPAKPYSFQTVERLRESFGDATRLFFVMGADSFQEIDTWREPGRLLSSADLVVVTRPGSDLGHSHLPAQLNATVIDLRDKSIASQDLRAESEGHRIYLTDFVNVSISSTEIRRRVRSGETISGMVPSRVAEYMQKYELYKS